MFSFSFFKSNQNDQKNKVYNELDKFYQSFFNNTYNELNIDKYRQIRDAIGLVMRKFDSDDHPLEYTSKLVMYIQARVVLKHLRLSSVQQKIMQTLSEQTKYINLSYVYTCPLDDVTQFENA